MTDETNTSDGNTILAHEGEQYGIDDRVRIIGGLQSPEPGIIEGRASRSRFGSNCVTVLCKELMAEDMTDKQMESMTEAQPDDGDGIRLAVHPDNLSRQLN